MGAGRWGSGGGGGGIHGAVTVTLDGGGGAALMTPGSRVTLDDRMVVGGGGGDGGDFVVACTILAVREIGGDGGRVIGGLRTLFIIAGLAIIAGCDTAAVSCRQSCDWCNEDGVAVVAARTGGERGSRMLCALATLATLLARFSFLGGGDGFCRPGDGGTAGLLGTAAADFAANPLGTVSELLVVAESVVLCP